jgi:hypothetical protein
MKARKLTYIGMTQCRDIKVGEIISVAGHPPMMVTVTDVTLGTGGLGVLGDGTRFTGLDLSTEQEVSYEYGSCDLVRVFDREEPVEDTAKRCPMAEYPMKGAVEEQNLFRPYGMPEARIRFSEESYMAVGLMGQRLGPARSSFFDALEDARQWSQRGRSSEPVTVA